MLAVSRRLQTAEQHRRSAAFPHRPAAASLPQQPPRGPAAGRGREEAGPARRGPWGRGAPRGERRRQPASFMLRMKGFPGIPQPGASPAAGGETAEPPGDGSARPARRHPASPASPRMRATTHTLPLTCLTAHARRHTRPSSPASPCAPSHLPHCACAPRRRPAPSSPSSSRSGGGFRAGRRRLRGRGRPLSPSPEAS